MKSVAVPGGQISKAMDCVSIQSEVRRQDAPEQATLLKYEPPPDRSGSARASAEYSAKPSKEGWLALEASVGVKDFLGGYLCRPTAASGSPLAFLPALFLFTLLPILPTLVEKCKGDPAANPRRCTCTWTCDALRLCKAEFFFFLRKPLRN